MGSLALQELLLGLSEVASLRAFPPRRVRAASRAKSIDYRAAAIGHRRACTVLLCSHFERYIYSLNEQATEELNLLSLQSSVIPVKIRLLQVRQPIAKLAEKQWDQRERDLEEFVLEYAHMWSAHSNVTTLIPQPHLESMKSPKVPDIIKFFQLFGIDDIFSGISRTPSGRRRLTRALQSLVDSRNGIAHGDRNVQPERSELTQYIDAVRDFATRSDRMLSRRIGAIGGCPPPW